MNAPQRYTIKLKNKKNIARNTESFTFHKPEGFSFEAGQFATVRIPSVAEKGNPAGAVHALSFASAPSDEDVVFAWRKSESDFKKAADALNIGECIEMIAPAGHATVPGQGKIIFLVGGIGITPVRSILRQAQKEEKKRDFVLFYSNRTPDDAPFFEEFVRYEESGVCRIVLTMTEADASWSGERGFISADMVQKYTDGCKDAIYYIVGTGGFVSAMENVVRELGVTKEKIICDNFG